MTSQNNEKEISACCGAEEWVRRLHPERESVCVKCFEPFIPSTVNEIKDICCENCREKCMPQIDGTRYICINYKCQCHSPSPTSEVKEEKCKRGGNISCNCTKCQIGDSPQSSQKKEEKREPIRREIAKLCPNIYFRSRTILADYILDIQESAIQDTLEKVREKVFKWIEENTIYAGESKADSGEMGQYNRALEDMRKFINENS